MHNDERQEYHKKWHELLELMHQLDNNYAQYAKQHQLTVNELCLCYELYVSQECTPAGIADRWSIPKQTVNGCLRHLEKQGYITLETHPRDARSKIICLTPSGEAYVRQLISPLTEAEMRALQQIPLQEIDAVIDFEKRYNQIFQREIAQDNGNETRLG